MTPEQEAVIRAALAWYDDCGPYGPIYVSDSIEALATALDTYRGAEDYADEDARAHAELERDYWRAQ